MPESQLQLARPRVSIAPRIDTSVASAVLPVGDVLSAFLDSLDSPNTRRNYEREVRGALAAMQINTLDQINGATLAEWRRRVTESGLAPASQKVAVAAVRSFLRFARMVEACRLRQDVVSAALKTPKGGKQRAYTILSDPEIARMLAAATNERDTAILAVLFGSGIRVSELVGLDVDDVLSDVEGGAALRVRAGKGNKPRTVPVRDEVATTIRRYLRATGRTLRDTGALFRAHDNGAAKRSRRRLSARSVNRILADCARPGGDPRQGREPACLPPQLRHAGVARRGVHGHRGDAARP